MSEAQPKQSSAANVAKGQPSRRKAQKPSGTRPARRKRKPASTSAQAPAPAADGEPKASSGQTSSSEGKPAQQDKPAQGSSSAQASAQKGAQKDVAAKKAPKASKTDKASKAAKDPKAAPQKRKPSKRPAKAAEPAVDAPPQKPKKKKKAPRKAPTIRETIMGITPIACMIVAFVGMIGLYRFVFPPVVEGTDSETTALAADPVQGEAAQVPAYTGVSDPWLASGVFTTGEEELDPKVKAVCDAFTAPENDARGNAQTVYNNIAWNFSYADRGDNNKPAGPTWDLACAKEFFGFAKVDQGAFNGGEADYYEVAAATSYILRYFGYTDALAVPVLVDDGTGTGQTTGSAYCLVTDENGNACVCDPSLGASGWMLSRYSYNITVEDIGQDLTSVEAMGLNIYKEDNTESKHVGAGATKPDEPTSTVTSDTETEATDATVTDAETEYSVNEYDDTQWETY